MSTLGTFALASAPYHTLNGAYKRPCLLQVCLTFVAGVPSISVARSAPGFTIAGDAGLYTGTAPKGARGIFNIQMVNATIGSFASVVSYVPTTGVFAFNTFTATNAALDVATGDEAWLLFLIEGG